MTGREVKTELRGFLIETSIYTVFIAGYLWAVNRFFADWLYRAFSQQRALYAVTALVLILIQGAMLEAVTRALAGWIMPKHTASGEKHR